MEEKESIFIIEDDDNIRDLIQIALKGFGYSIKAFETAEEALEQMEEEIPDLAVFDWMLPGMDGLSAISRIRETPRLSAMPMILLTAKDKEFDKVAGLDGGADDYMTKPFGVMELAARIRNLLKRRQRSADSRQLLNQSGIFLNLKTREVFVKDTPVELTLKEFELLHYLMENHGRVTTRDELLNRIWGYDYDGETRTLDMHIRTLRQKLGQEGAGCIKTVRGVGYRLIKSGEA